jgi:hypothetical protein
MCFKHPVSGAELTMKDVRNQQEQDRNGAPKSSVVASTASGSYSKTSSSKNITTGLNKLKTSGLNIP